MDRFAAEVAQRPIREEDARKMHLSRRAYFRAMAIENQARRNATLIPRHSALLCLSRGRPSPEGGGA